MQDFEELVRIIDRLLAPDGCAWDRKQTLHSMRGALVEEAYEVVDAIEQQDATQIQDELGDLLFCSTFLCRLAEKEKKGSLQQALQQISEKLIRRHPHVFADAKVATEQEVLEQWEALKKDEKKGAEKQVDVPRAMPALARAERLAKYKGNGDLPPITQSELAEQLYELAQRARVSKLDPEQILSDHITAQLAHKE